MPTLETKKGLPSLDSQPPTLIGAADRRSLDGTGQLHPHSQDGNRARLCQRGAMMALINQRGSKERICSTMCDISKAIKNERRKLITAIHNIFVPHMWDSGYMIGGRHKTGDSENSRPMKLWAPRDGNGRLITVTIQGYLLSSFCGYSENGLITDAYGGGCLTEPLSGYPIEDMLILKAWSEKQFFPMPSTKPATPRNTTRR